MIRKGSETVLLLIGCMTGALHAAEFTTSVPLDLLAPLTQGGRLYRDLPPGFPALTLPEGLSVIGSLDAPRQQLVLLRSLPDGRTALEALRGELEARGWQDADALQASQRGGFIVPDTGNNLQLSLCHDSEGVMQLRGETGVENRAYLQRPKPVPGEALSCSQRYGDRGRPPVPPPSTLDRYLPRLELSGASPADNGPPDRAGIGIRGIMNVMGSGNGDLERSFQASLPGADAASVEARYAAQLLEQGWQRDSGWQSADAAGSGWTRSPENGPGLFFSLTVEEVGEDGFNSRLRLLELE